MAMLRLSRIAFLSLRVWKVEGYDMKEEEEEGEEKEKKRRKQARKKENRGAAKGKEKTRRPLGAKKGGMGEKGVESKDG